MYTIIQSIYVDLAMWLGICVSGEVSCQMYVYLDAIDTCDSLKRPLRMAT